MAVDDKAQELQFPQLPVKHSDFIQYVADNPNTPVAELLKPFKQYDAELRKAFAQQPDHPAVKQPNILPVFAGHEQAVKIRARNLSAESEKEKECFIMPLKKNERKQGGSSAIVSSLQQFTTQFSLFSESALADLDWSNVVAAGSSVVTPLLPVPEKYAGSKRAMREYYHEKFAPASDVDLFIYGLTEEQAIDKIKQIEQSVKDALLVETTTIRTKNAITIASQYPVRHIQIVLRIYKSISEILTGFDVDCSCAAFDGHQVYVSPRALAAYVTQTNTIDLTRRSPSYENRLAKYSHRGFEAHWPDLDRSRIDPTIFERSFGRTEGLARLLVLEKLPNADDRDKYMDQRRAERGRPPANRTRARERMLHGNIKDQHEYEVAEWVDAEEVSDYHTFTVPYGPKFHAKKIEKLLFTKDLLLNAEWNKPKDREVHLHRHPAFFGTVNDIVHDCCGYCPKPTTVEEEEVAEEESKIYISGDITFIKDDPGRQTIGSFNPLSADDYTEMAYVGNTELLCRAIIDGDLNYVESWLSQEDNDPNTRDFTGRTTLHLAVSQSTVEIVQSLIDHGARLVARLVDGKTALHIAAMRGNTAMVEALLKKSSANEEEENEKVDARRRARQAAKDGTQADGSTGKSNTQDASDEDSDVDMIDDVSINVDATTENSIVNIKSLSLESTDKALDGENDDEPDVYDVNVLAWDTAVSPLHLAIVKGHVDVVKVLVEEFGADVLLPVKLFDSYTRAPDAALLTLVLAMQLPMEKAEEMVRTLFNLGATSSQADFNGQTAFLDSVLDSPKMLDIFCDADDTGVKRSINHFRVSGSQWTPDIGSPLKWAIDARDSLTALKLLTLGAKGQISFEAYAKAYQSKFTLDNHLSHNRTNFETSLTQPVIAAVQCELPEIALELVEKHGINVNTLSTNGHNVIANTYQRNYTKGTSLLDVVREKIQELREWKPSENEDEPPKPLKDDAEYLAGIEPGTYKWWCAQHQLKAAKERFKEEWEQHVTRLKASRDRKGEPEKQAAIFDLLERYRKLETFLVGHSAKTFKELHPDIEDPKEDRNNRYNYSYTPYKPPYFEQVDFSFGLGDVGDDARDRYVELFSAIWNGDVKTVKQLTLMPWHDVEGNQHPPLKIGVRDCNSLNPFGIAVTRGHLDLAKTIIEIVDAQYCSPEEQKKERTRIRGEDDEDLSEDDESGSDIALATEVVNDQFTIDNVGEVSLQVKGTVKPFGMLSWHTYCKDFEPNADSAPTSLPISSKRTNTGSVKALKQMAQDEQNQREVREPWSVLHWAIRRGDRETLTFLLDISKQYFSQQEFEESTDSLFYEALTYAFDVDNPSIAAEIIKRTGAGIPLNQSAKKTGVELTEKPEYYQGLSVYGKKRKDWAARGRATAAPAQTSDIVPPLLEAANTAALESVQWLLSDAPLRCYRKFAEANKDDGRLQRLEKAGQSFDSVVQNFLSARSKLALHCAIMAKPTPESLELISYLVETIPEAIDLKSEQGITPLHIAFQLYREDAVKVLIAAGADQTARDKDGYNILHHLLGQGASYIATEKHLNLLRRMLDLVDKRLLDSLFQERNAARLGSKTPLALSLDLCRGKELGSEILSLILDFSKGMDLNIIDGEGNTPLHSIIRLSNCQLIELSRVILKHSPHLVNRENSTGRTPYEIIEDTIISGFFHSAPPLPMFQQYWSRRQERGIEPYHFGDTVKRDSESFVEKPQKNESSPTVSWALVRQTRADLEARGESKRILVTLNEANEVARRLAATKSGREQEVVVDAGQEKENDEGDKRDEVAKWLGLVKPSMVYIREDKTSFSDVGTTRRRLTGHTLRSARYG